MQGRPGTSVPNAENLLLSLLLDVFNHLLRVRFGRGWVEARAILTRRGESILRGEAGVVNGLRAAAAEMRCLNRR